MKAFEGAYFARHLEQARQEGRICRAAVDSILPVKAFFDIGGAGHSSDAMAIWIAQFVGREIRLSGSCPHSQAGVPLRTR